MNKTFPLASLYTALAFSCAVPVTVQAADRDDALRANYWAVQGGPNHLSSWPGEVNFGGPRSDASLTLASGATVGLVLGRQIGKARYDLEYQHGQLDITAVRIAALSENVDSRLKYDTLTVNASRQLRLSESLLLFAGAGVGVGRVNLPTIGLTVAKCKCITSASETGAVVQLRIGMDYQLDDNRVAYLQLGATRLPGASSGALPTITYARRDVATMAVGYRGLFN
ncbi:MAG: hypothetical protein V4693_18045 [Pseudomonadota bacterium]